MRKMPVPSRKRFLLASSSAGFFLAAPAVRAAQFEFKCGSELAREDPAVVRLVEMWSAIERESGGRVHGKVFPNNELGNPTAMFSQLRLGALQFQLIGAGNIAAVVPAFDITTLGFAFKDADEGVRACDGPLGGYLQQEAAAKNVYLFPKVFDIGMYQIGSFPRAIRTPDDLRGFKIRVSQSKLLVELFKELGASPTPLSFDEIYTALQTKLIDGEAAPLSTIQVQRFYEVNHFVSLTNHAWAVSWLIANGDIWKSVPADLAQIIERNAVKYTLLERRDNKQLTASVLDKLRRQGLAVNVVDQGPFRAHLGTYYANAATTFGPTAMGLLQNSLSHKLS